MLNEYFQVGSYQNHHVSVAAVAISPLEDRLVSLGGQVDYSQVEHLKKPSLQ